SHRHVGAVVAGEAVGGGARLGRDRHDRHQHTGGRQRGDERAPVRVAARPVRLQRLGEVRRGRAVVAGERADGVVAALPGDARGVGQRGLLAEVGGQGPTGPSAGVGVRARRSVVLVLRGVLGGHGRPATSSASPIVKACAYRALPTIAPSTPTGTSSRSARRSSREEMPPEATTFASVRSQTWASRSTFGPWRVPSLVTSVTT